MTKENGGKLVIINLMETPLDLKCDLRIFGKSDQVFKLLAQEMSEFNEVFVTLTDSKIPSFKWNINIWVGNTCTKKSNGKYQWTLYVTGEYGFQSNFLKK